MKPLDNALVAQANVAYAEFRNIGHDCEDNLIRWVNKGREVGLSLQMLRDQNRHWEQLALPIPGAQASDVNDEPRLQFSEPHARLFMRLSEKDEAKTAVDAISALKECAILQGTLELPCGHGKQQHHEKNPLSFIVTRTMEIQATWNRDLREDVSGWDLMKLQHFDDQLEPVVKIANEVKGRIREMERAA
jgi:hypothetical protein